MKTIEWTTRAFRQLRKIRDPHIQVTIYDAVDTLRSWPDCRNVKKLENRSEYRLRIGRWRVLFVVRKTLEIITINEVKKRNEQTY